MAIDNHIPLVLVLAAAVEVVVDVVHRTLPAIDLVLAVMAGACRIVVVVVEVEHHIAYVVEVVETNYIHRDFEEVHREGSEVVGVHNWERLQVAVEHILLE